MTRWGYTRISTVHQDPDLQRRAIIDAGVEEKRIFGDVITGSSSLAGRTGWRELMDRVRPGDEIVCFRIDRVGRSVADVVSTVEALAKEGVTVRSILDGIDPSTSGGKMLLGLMSTLAEYERDLIRERVKAGMDAARARGVKFGRQPLDVVAEAEKAKIVARLIDEGKPVAEAGAMLGWSRATTYRRLALLEDQAVPA